MVEHDAGAEDVVVDADQMWQLRVQDHAQALPPQAQVLLLLEDAHRLLPFTRPLLRQTTHLEW